jgi:hypothetical protein
MIFETVSSSRAATSRATGEARAARRTVLAVGGLPHTLGAAAMVFALTAATTSCRPAIGAAAAEVPRAATGPLIDETLQQFEDEATRRRIADVLATPEVQRAMQELSSALTSGAVMGLTREDVAAQVAEHGDRLVRALLAAMASSMREEMAPAVAELTRHAVAAAMEGALAEGNRAALERLASGMTRSATQAAMRAMAEEIPNELAPAMRRAMTEEITPAMREMMREAVAPSIAEMVRSPELASALGATTRVVAREAVLGSNEGMAQLEQRGKPGLLARVATLFGRYSWVLWVAAMATVGLITWLVARAAQRRTVTRRDLRERELHDAVLLTLARAVRAADGRPWADELRDALREDLRRGDGETLDTLLGGERRARATVPNGVAGAGGRVGERADTRAKNGRAHS